MAYACPSLGRAGRVVRRSCDCHGAYGLHHHFSSSDHGLDDYSLEDFGCRCRSWTSPEWAIVENDADDPLNVNDLDIVEKTGRRPA